MSEAKPEPEPHHYLGTLTTSLDGRVTGEIKNSLGYTLEVYLIPIQNGEYHAVVTPGPIPAEWSLGDYEP